MSAEIKYYKYIDSKGNLNKSLGVLLKKRLPQGVIRGIKGDDGISKLVVTSETFVNREENVKPKIYGLVEVFKSEYDGIDTSKEDVLSLIARNKYEIYINKLYEKYKDGPNKTVADFLVGASKATGLKIATPTEAQILLTRAS